MRKLLAWAFLAAIAAGIAGLAVTSERASAVETDLDCTAAEVGVVTCTLSVTDLPDPLQDFTLQLEATYNDNDGSGDPSPGDQLKCITVTGTGPNGAPINAEFCRDGSPPGPPPIP